MTRAEKDQQIKDLTEKLKNTSFFYIADSSGLNVAQINEFRQMCYQRGVSFQVVKNTLIKKALDQLDHDYSEFENSVLHGFSGIMFSPEAGNEPAKILKEFRKKNKRKFTKPELKGASIEGALYIGEENLDPLSELKSKNELIGDVIGLLQAPAKNVVSALQSGQHTLAGLVKTLSEKEENK